MTRVLIFPSVCVILLPLAMGLNSDHQRSIDMLIEKFLPSNNITGMGLTVVQGNDIMSKGYGFRDLDRNISADGDTLFSIGSISKSFTAILAVKTINEKFPDMEGDTALDVPIKQLVPSFDFMLIDRYRTESTTLRDLLSHRIGILSANTGWLLFGAYKDKNELLYRNRYAPEIDPFRTSLIYNNGGTIIAGEIIAAIANRTFEDMLTDLFRDIGMNDTMYISDIDDYEQIPNMSSAYYLSDGQPKEYNRNLLKRVSMGVAAGGILSTPNDMAKYMMFHLNNGKVGDRQIVPEVSMAYLKTCSNLQKDIHGKAEVDELFDTIVCYGLCVLVGFLDGWQKIFHNGYLTPFYSHMTLLPALKIGIFSTSNSPGALYDSSEVVHKQIYSVLQNGLNYEQAEGIALARKAVTKVNHDETLYPVTLIAKTEDNKADKIVNRLQKEEKELVGVYGNGLLGEFTVSKPNGTTGGNLYLTYGKWGTGELVRHSNNTFLIKWDSDLIQDYLALELGNMVEPIDFSVENTAILGGVSFIKDLTLSKLPVQPWDPNCSGAMNSRTTGKISYILILFSIFYSTF